MQNLASIFKTDFKTVGLVSTKVQSNKRVPVCFGEHIEVEHGMEN